MQDGRPFASGRFVLLITGASKGLGRAIAEEWAAPGARIAIAARGADLLRGTAEALRRKGAHVFALAGDLEDPSFPARLVRETEQALGPVTHLVTCASSLGGVPLRPIADVDDFGWASAISTNILATVRLWREVLPNMEVALGGGRLLHISSDAALDAYAHWGPYSATKAAVDHLVRILGAELKEHRVENLYAYAVDPGDMDTDMHRAAIPEADPTDLLQPGDVAPALARLLREDPPRPSGRYRAAELGAEAS